MLKEALEASSNKIPISRLLDLRASKLKLAILNIVKASIPLIRLGARPKPWWNSNL